MFGSTLIIDVSVNVSAAEHSSLNSSIGKHMYDMLRILKPNLTNNFSVRKKCCLIHEMLKLTPSAPSYLIHNHKETKCLLYCFHLQYLYSITKKQPLCLDNDDSIIETSDCFIHVAEMTSCSQCGNWQIPRVHMVMYFIMIENFPQVYPVIK